jgi:hypothetical protein
VLVETDQALAALLKAKVIGSAPISIAFDPPSRPWIQSLKVPCVNVFLFDLREAVSRRESSHEDVRDENGKIIARRPPMQRWDLHYTVTVFAPQVIAEHKILAAVLRYLASIDVIEPEFLPPELAALGYPILVSTGGGMKRGMFLNYAGDMKVGFEMSITVPIPPLPPPPLAPPVRQPPQIQVAPVPGADPARTVAATETVPPPPAAQQAPPPAAQQAPAPQAPAPTAQQEPAHASTTGGPA